MTMDPQIIKKMKEEQRARLMTFLNEIEVLCLENGIPRSDSIFYIWMRSDQIRIYCDLFSIDFDYDTEKVSLYSKLDDQGRHFISHKFDGKQYYSKELKDEYMAVVLNRGYSQV